ncbi:aminotransferase class V-fold PLP-dependent enzyme [Marinomonas aquiplantarum]|uniref:Selenocysteine lyase/cysteine desulfurase n=1 Tax=Marinomonas aquiplantarum TaxID=491951 RepID=A0A366D3K4_9GAMM|nr:aminotransferase class V-fold PLP-dependent enzyme [Marinomonas aquiplantarum]RBO84079.1 selenocysteine lyase/cysteine desulfurase [Marinomonas aquiplantarum]
MLTIDSPNVSPLAASCKTTTYHLDPPSMLLLDTIRRSIIGAQQNIITPFGERKLTYADYTASGRSLDFIEQAVQKAMPFYANTHTEANATGMQTTAYREQAREEIRKAVNASPEDLVIFCGSGATSAINTLISQLGLRQLDATEKTQTRILIGPYEHHSNELPWRELGIPVIRIQEGEQGGVCLQDLEKQLQQHQDKRLIGSFSAASNVTGILSDQDAITSLLHAYNALSFWDFAAAAPYVKIDMNPAQSKHQHKNAIFFSPHKFIGGPGTPGVLIVKKSCIENAQPSHVGGGTVSFVTPNDHTFLPISERREEGGTPAILESIRAGLVFKLKSLVGDDVIQQQEHQFVKLIDQHWQNHPSIERLGHSTAERISITAFRIKTSLGYLHHGFVTALLNDLFGIQMRGGCSCAGPYGHALLNIDEHKSEQIQQALKAGEKLLKPGWVRFNLNYFISQQEADFILRAIDFISQQGLTFLPFYGYDQHKDLWRFQNQRSTAMSLDDLFELEDVYTEKPTQKETQQPHSESYESYLTQAKQLAETLKTPSQSDYVKQTQPFNHAYESLRDFVLVTDL